MAFLGGLYCHAYIRGAALGMSGCEDYYYEEQ
jgi:hypothetical protein